MKVWFVRPPSTAQLRALTLLLLTVWEMYREYVLPRGQTHIIDRQIHRRDVRHGGLITEIHAIVSVSEKSVRQQTTGTHDGVLNRGWAYSVKYKDITYSLPSIA